MSRLQHHTVHNPLIPTPYDDSIGPIQRFWLFARPQRILVSSKELKRETVDAYFADFPLYDKAVTLDKNVIAERSEVADYALGPLHCLKIYVNESYCNALNMLSSRHS